MFTVSPDRADETSNEQKATEVAAKLSTGDAKLEIREVD
jgi:hypothetical protein